MPRLSDPTGRAALRRVEDDILRETENRFERLVLLDGQVRPLLVKDGSSGEVYLTEEEAAPFVGKADLITHNHPRGTSFTDGDVLSAIALGVREVNAFGPLIRYRLCRTPGGNGWPAQEVAEASIREIDLELRDLLRPRVMTGELSPLEAEALHRRLRWGQFARRFAADVDYVEEHR